MTETLNELARKLIGTKGSPFFVTMLNEMEFDSSPVTVAAFMSIDDATDFANGIILNAHEALIVEGPEGVYLELTQGSRTSFMGSGKLAITTPFGKTVLTAN